TLTANSDGSATLSGTFTSGTLSIPVTGTISAYQFGGSLGYHANFSFSGTVLNPFNPLAGYAVTYLGVLFQSNQHATTSGQLQPVVSDNPIGAIVTQPSTPVSGNWF